MSNVLYIISEISIAVSIFCFLIIVIDISSKNYQTMWIMNIVWPITALYSGPIGLWLYLKIGKLSTRKQIDSQGDMDKHMRHNSEKPFWQSAVVSTTHCGAGCSLGDLTAEWIFLLIPFTLFGQKIFGAWLIDYCFALLFGIVFQYFNIKPMKNLSRGKALAAAIKADFFSLTSWQIGMYGWMAIVTFVIFGHEISVTNPVFWFMMQIAMIFGFATSYPINRLLLHKGIKEKM